MAKEILDGRPKVITVSLPTKSQLAQIADTVATGVSRLNPAGRFRSAVATVRNQPVKKTLQKLVPFFIILIFAVIAVGVLRNALAGSAAKDQRVQIAGALAHVDINKSFTFPLNDAGGKTISNIGYEVDSAEIRNEILVQGQRASAIEGKTFLIFEVKITNNYSKAIDINTRDYLRLTANGKTGELLAPDIHNDPVNVQATSTKYVRVGYAISDTDKNLVLLVGEINGQKTPIALNLKYKQ